VAIAVLAVTVGCASTGAPKLLPYTIEAAAASKKPLVVEFYADWCKPCHHFEKHILTDPRVVAVIDRFTFVRYDIETGAGRDAYRRCRGTGIPLLVGIDPSGVVRSLKKGTEFTADEFLEFLSQTYAVLGPQYAAGAR
jgi:thiol:disulfide interchange protein DsbD